MGYVAIEIEGKRAYYSKGANKLAKKIGCNPKTILKNLPYVGSNHLIKGYTVTKTEDIPNKRRGKSLNGSFYG